MVFRHPVSNGLTIRSDLDAAEDICCRRRVLRIAHPVGFDEANSQVVGAALARDDRHRHKDVATHQRRKEHQGLKLKERLPSFRIAVHAFRPQPPFTFGVFFPLFRLLLGKAEELRIDLGIQRKPGPNDVCSNGLERASCQSDPI